MATVIGVLIVCIIAAAMTARWWLPSAQVAIEQLQSSPQSDDRHDHESSTHTHTGHDHAGHDEETSLSLTEQGRKNIDLTVTTVELRDFERTISMPATLVERSGRTEIAVSAPMTGIVTRIYPIAGEAVSPGDPLFDLRMTHEDLVEKQSSLLRSMEELDVVKREVARLEDVTASGAVAARRLLESQYEQQKTEAAIRAEKQALLLHGLSKDQIRQIEDERQLLQKLTIFAPPMTDCKSNDGHAELLQVAQLAVRLGEHVATGSLLATLTDHCELHIEGKAFEQDADALNAAANAGAEVTAIIEGNGSGDHEVAGLRILYVQNRVERDSRALKFYVPLPNELVRNEETPDGNRFIGWRYKPGQRVEVLVPVQKWVKRIVVPVEAVVQDGTEFYVYQQIKGHFDRKPVHVEYRDQRHAVLESDGTLFPGDKVAAQGAYQIHLALKRKAGGGPDAHAGHHH
jgi:multidrug efflux pump subunit AcrA (membrane-fusion protein)